jgi:hypothetical protein
MGMSKHHTDRMPSRLEDPFDSIEEPAFQLFTKMCERYEWYSDKWRTKVRKVLEALIEYLDYDTSLTWLRGTTKPWRTPERVEARQKSKTGCVMVGWHGSRPKP